MDQQIKLTFEHPRSWWRRLLRLPAKHSERGPYNVRPWSDAFETEHGTVAQAGWTMNVRMDNTDSRFTTTDPPIRVRYPATTDVTFAISDPDTTNEPAHPEG